MKKIATLLTLSLVLGFYSSHAQTNMFWDVNGTTAGLGGTGNWTAAGTSWATNNSSGTATVGSGAWGSGNNNIAIFAGTAGTVTLSSASVYANLVQINVTGYTLSIPSGANRYIYSTNGMTLADGITLNLSPAASTYNNGAFGITGVITNTNGSTAAFSTIAITGNSGTTAGSGIRIGSRIGASGTAGTNNWFVNLNVKTTGTGGAIIGTADSGSVLNIRGTITVDSGSILNLSPGAGTTRQVSVYSNIITSSSNALVIGEATNTGLVELRASNTITGDLPVFGQLAYRGSLNALGQARVVLNNGSTFGQNGTISGGSETIANNIRVDGDVTFGSYGNSCYFAGNIDLNSGTRTIAMGNSTVLSGAVTNGSYIHTNSSATRTFTVNGNLSLTNFTLLGTGTNIFNGTNALINFTNSSAGITSLNGDNTISNVVISSGSTVMGAGANTINSFAVSGGFLSAPNLGAGTKSLNLTGAGVSTATFSNTASSGFLATGPLTLGGSNNFVMSTAGSSSVTSSGAITLSGSGNTITLNGAVLASGQTYTLFSGTSVNTNGLTGPVTLTGAGVNNAPGLVLNGSSITSGKSIYTFRSTATALELQVDANTNPDLSWSGGASGNWNYDPSNANWTLGGSSVSFASGNNAIIDTTASGVALILDSAGITAGYVTTSGTNGTTLSGGNLTAIALTSSGSDLTVNTAVTLTNLSLTNASLTGSGSITTTAGTTVLCDTNEILGVPIAGTGGITKTGTATLTLSAPGAYSGGLTIGAGTLATSGDEIIPDAVTATLSSNAVFRLGGNETLGALSAAFGSTNDLQGFTLTVGGNNVGTTNGALTIGTGRIVKNGTGLYYLNQSGSTFSGGFNLNNGDIAFTSSGTYGADGVVTNSVFGTGTLTINGGTLRSTGATTGRDIANEVVVGGDMTFGAAGNSGTMTLNATAGKKTTLTNSATITCLAAVSWEQPITATGLTLTKSGTNDMSIRGASTIGTLVAAQGNLYVRSSNNFTSVLVANGARLGYGITSAPASTYFGGATIVLSNGATFGQNYTNGLGTDAERTLPNNIRVLGDVTLGLGNFSSYLGGNIDLNAGTRTVGITNSTYLSGSITNGGLSITNSSATRVLNLLGSSSYRDGTSLNGGWLNLGHDNALGTGGLTVNPGSASSTLTATDGRNITNAVSLTGSVSLSVDSGSTNAPSTTWTASGAISGAGSIVKTGVGTLRLTGPLSYSGATTVTNGTLVVVTNNIAATITNNTVQITFSNSPANGTYAFLPGTLTGTYTLTNTVVDPTQKVTLSTAGPASVTVASKASQTITGLASSDTKTFGSTAYSLNVLPGASTSSLTFSSDTTSVATVSTAGVVTIVGAGSTTIRVNQAGDANYLPATEVTHVLTVTAASQTAVSGSLGSSTVDFGGTTTVTASGGAGTGAYEFRQNGGTGAVSFSGTGTTRTINTTTAGTAVIEVRRLGDANYTDSSWVSAGTLTVNAPTPTGPTLTSAYPDSTPLGVNPQNGLTYLMSYALGGDSSNAPTLPSQVDEAGKLALVAVVRTNDTNVSVVGEAVGSLADYANPSSITAVNGTTSNVSQTYLPAGCERRKYSVDQGSNDRQFLRLKAIQK